MPYHETIEQDIERARLILKDGISGNHIYAAGEILKSFIEEIERLQSENKRIQNIVERLTKQSCD